jgi:hypothetical protein
MQTEMWAVILHDIQGLLKVLSSADQDSVVKIPDIQEEVGTLLLNALNQRLQDKGEEEGGKRVPLMNAKAAEEMGLVEEEMGVGAVAFLDPSRKSRAACSHLLHQHFTVNQVEGVVEVDL